MTIHGKATSRRMPACAFGVLAILLGGIATAPAASAAGDASGFIDEFGRNAIAIMKEPAITTDDRQHRFQNLMVEDFDLPRIAQFVLGGYWSNANDTEKQQFLTAFVGYMAGIYSIRFAEFNGPSFHVTGQLARSETTTVVSSAITRMSNGQEIDLEWVVAKTPAGYKVIDITAGGISLSLAQREEFASVVQRNADRVSNLIQQLQMKSTELATLVQ
jgi:phospholipid transport system substrate-binding protein